MQDSHSRKFFYMFNEPSIKFHRCQSPPLLRRKNGCYKYLYKCQNFPLAFHRIDTSGFPQSARQWWWCYFTLSSLYPLQTLVSLVWSSSPTARCRHFLVLAISAGDLEQQILEKWVWLVAWPMEAIPKKPCARVKTIEQNVTKCKVCSKIMRDFSHNSCSSSFFNPSNKLHESCGFSSTF